MADQQVKITISAIDNATKALNDVKNSLKGVSKETDNTQQSFFTLKNAIIGFASVALISLGKQIIGVTKEFQELRANIITAVGSVEKGTETFNRLSEFAKTTNFSIAQIARTFLTLSQNGVAPTNQLLDVFAKTAGVATNKVDALNDLTRLFARGAQGGFNIQSLNQLVANGIPAFQILREELGLDEKALIRLSNTADGSKLILDNLFIGLQKRAESQVKPLFDLNKSFKNFYETIEAGLFQIGDQKELADFVDLLTGLLVALQPIVDVITFLVKQVLQGLIFALQTINPLIGFFSEIISDLVIPIKGVADSIKDSLTEAFAEMAKGINYLRNKYKELKEFIFGKPIKLEVVAPKTKAVIEEETKVPVELTSTQQTVQALQVAAFDLRAQFKDIYSTIAQGMVTGIKDFSKAVAESIVLGKKLEDSFRQIAQNLLVKILSGLIEEQLAKLALLVLDEIAVLLGLKKLAIEKAITAEQRKRITEGTGDATTKEVKPEEMAKEQLSKIIDTLYSKLTESFDTVLGSIKTIFGEIGTFTNEILGGLSKSIGEIITALASNLSSILGSLGGGSSGGGGFLGSLINIGIGAFGGGGMTPIDASVVSPFAEGGAVRGGMPITVGERGRELFVPSTDGTIVPNHDMGGGSNINFNIQSNDVRGIKELLINNRATIINLVNQGANKKGKSNVV